MYINETHKSLANAPVEGAKIIHEIRGSLRPEDAARLYEMAYQSSGDVLDLGTNQGLSAFIMASALNEAGTAHQVTTIDLDPTMTERALKTFEEKGAGNIECVTADAAQWCAATPRIYHAAFVDHSHAYEPVAEVCRLLDRILAPRAIVCFHDFHDRRNADPEYPEYGVMLAVIENLPDSFERLEDAGCMAVFQFHG